MLCEVMEARLESLERKFAELELFVNSGNRRHPTSLSYHDEDRPPTPTLLGLVGNSGCTLHHHPTDQHSVLMRPGTHLPPWAEGGAKPAAGTPIYRKKIILPRFTELVEGKWPDSTTT